MKRVVPAIVILITLSVLGILYTQVQWIRNARLVKQEQQQRALQTALVTSRNGIQEFFLEEFGYAEYLATNSMKQEALARSFSAQRMAASDISSIIEKSLNDNGIQTPFEFAVYNVYGYAIVASAGFRKELIPGAQTILLTPEIAGGEAIGEADEILYLSVKEPRGLPSSMTWMLVASVLLIGIVIAAFSLTVHTIFSQRKLAQIKTDFINNMTHEFKTPLATISLATDALNNPKVIHDETQIRYYSGMIKDENKRMNKQVETILQAARLEKNDLQLQLEAIDAHAVIRKVAETLSLRIAERNGELNLQLAAARHIIMADDVHFSNIVFNLLDNAIKYSGDKPLLLDVETQSAKGLLAIRFTDKGIGMSKETANRIFEKFYRAHTGDLHNVKGFGLGLSYVKTMVEAHGGRIKVESAAGKGSTFTTFFPLASDKQLQASESQLV